MNKCVIYSRVSTNEQSVSNQLQVLREIAEKKGLEIVREISDEDISGAKGRDESIFVMCHYINMNNLNEITTLNNISRC